MKRFSPTELKYIETGRRKARTDLLWLCHNILDMNKVVPHVHGPIINFLQDFKDQGTDTYNPERDHFDYAPIDPDPVNVLKGHRRRLILAPRGWYKTSVNVIAHSIQWILNYPDVTILLVHASQEMAEQIIKNVKDKFQNNTAMRYFFPEFCPPKRREWDTQQWFNSPARKNFTTAPTMQVAGIETVRTGMHYHLIKFTDIVDEKNTTTKEQMEKIVYRYGMARNLLISPRYWIDMEGTRYHFSDLYGKIGDQWLKEEEKGLPEAQKSFTCFTMGCYKKDVGARAERFTPDELDIANFPYKLDEKGRKISRFPEEFPLEKLEEMRNDPITGEFIFATQQLLNPIETSDEMAFPLTYLRWKDPEDISRVPAAYHILTIDLGETTGKKSDPTVLTVAKVDRTNRRYIVDIRRGKFLPDKIVSEMFELIFKYRPWKVKIEETGFLRGLKPAIMRRCQELGVYPNFDFIQRDTQISKPERILSLQPFYKSGQLYFSTALADDIKEQLKHELTKFPKYVHDDILDTLADQFQNEEVFGPIKERQSMKELLDQAHNTMLANLDKYHEIFGTKEPNASWEGLGAL